MRTQSTLTLLIYYGITSTRRLDILVGTVVLYMCYTSVMRNVVFHRVKYTMRKIIRRYFKIYIRYISIIRSSEDDARLAQGYI